MPDSFAPDAPDTQDVLDALDDPDCRTIIERIDGPMTATEIADACNIPLSTTYKKLALLTETGLLDRRARPRADGRHVARFVLAFGEVRIGLDETRSVNAVVDRRKRSPADRPSDPWPETGEET